MLLEEIKKRIRTAMLARDEATKSILRVAAGEIETEIARQGKVTEEREAAIVRKIITSNEETIAAGATNADKLKQENVVLADLLPKTLTLVEIEAFFLAHDSPTFEQIRDAANAGAATGLAMKALKAAGKSVLGNDVKTIVEKIRA